MRSCKYPRAQILAAPPAAPSPASCSASSASRGRAATPEFLREVSELELTFTQFKTLMLLAEHAGTLSVKDVSDRLGISFPAASRAVEPLVQRGIVERAEDPLDRRVKRVRTTGRATAWWSG